MATARSPALGLFILVSLLLAPILALQTREGGAPISSRELDAREAVPLLEAKSDGASSFQRRQRRDGFLPGADHAASGMASRRADEVTRGLEALDEPSGPEGERDADGVSTLQPRDPASGIGTSAPGGVNLEQQRSAPVTSAAPQVFGVNIYVIIVWLALLYLMYRTGSMF